MDRDSFVPTAGRAANSLRGCLRSQSFVGRPVPHAETGPCRVNLIVAGSRPSPAQCAWIRKIMCMTLTRSNGAKAKQDQSGIARYRDKARWWCSCRSSLGREPLGARSGELARRLGDSASAISRPKRTPRSRAAAISLCSHPYRRASHTGRNLAATAHCATEPRPAHRPHPHSTPGKGTEPCAAPSAACCIAHAPCPARPFSSCGRSGHARRNTPASASPGWSRAATRAAPRTASSIQSERPAPHRPRTALRHSRAAASGPFRTPQNFHPPRAYTRS